MKDPDMVQMDAHRDHFDQNIFELAFLKNKLEVITLFVLDSESGSPRRRTIPPHTAGTLQESGTFDGVYRFSGLSINFVPVEKYRCTGTWFFRTGIWKYSISTSVHFAKTFPEFGQNVAEVANGKLEKAHSRRETEGEGTWRCN